MAAPTTSLRPDEAPFHAPVNRGQRSKGRSAVAAAAYRAGERLVDDRIGRTFDYTRKQAIVDKLILAPADAPAWTQDRGQLWSRVEKAERRKDAQTWLDLEIAIPRDIPRDRWRAIAAEVAAPFVAQGAVADAAMHAPEASDGKENGHIHIMVTPRALDADGPQGFARLKLPMLERPEEITAYRARVADILNHHLRAVGSPRRVDHRSYAERGDDRIAEPKIGEREMARWRRQLAAHRAEGPAARGSRRLGEVAAVRKLKREQNSLLEEEIAMVNESMGISRIPYAQDKQAVKDRLLKERFPDLDLRGAGITPDSVYRVDVSKADTTRVLLRDDSIVEVRGGKVRLYGPDGDARRLGQAIAQAQGWDADTVERLPERARAAAPKGRYRRREDRAQEIERLVQAWQERGFTDVTASPKGVWVTIGASRLLDTGDRMSLHGPVSDDAINAMLDKAAAEWGGRCEIYGDDDFKSKMFLAAKLREPPVDITGYEPPDHVLAQLAALQKRQERQADQHQAAVASVASVADRAAQARELRRYVAGETDDPALPLALRAYADSLRDNRGEFDSRAARTLANMATADMVPLLSGMEAKGADIAQQQSEQAAPAPRPQPRPQDEQTPAPPPGPRMA